MNNVEKVKTITTTEAAKILGKSADFIRVGLQLNRFPFGTAVPPKKKGGRWNYIIIESSFLEYAGIKN